MRSRLMEAVYWTVDILRFFACLVQRGSSEITVAALLCLNAGSARVLSWQCTT